MSGYLLRGNPKDDVARVLQLDVDVNDETDHLINQMKRLEQNIEELLQVKGMGRRVGWLLLAQKRALTASTRFVFRLAESREDDQEIIGELTEKVEQYQAMEMLDPVGALEIKRNIKVGTMMITNMFLTRRTKVRKLRELANGNDDEIDQVISKHKEVEAARAGKRGCGCKGWKIERCARYGA